MKSLTNIFAYKKIFDFIEALKKMDDPEFKVSDFEFDGERWIGILARDKTTNEPKKIEK